MKILAFSDWRIHPNDAMINILKKERPDLILYSGDDLDRIVPPPVYVLIVSPNHKIVLHSPSLEPLDIKKSTSIAPRLKEFIGPLLDFSDTVLANTKLPFLYVQGNDDRIIKLNGMKFLQVNDGIFYQNESMYELYETPKGMISLRKYKRRKRHEVQYNSFENTNRTNKGGERQVGIYISINPTVGKTEFNLRGETLSFFCYTCTYGIGSRSTNSSGEFADFFLSHLPPKGILDLSARFGIAHIGSKRVRNDVEKYHPRFVVCGHSHIWGGMLQNMESTLVTNVSSSDTDMAAGNYAIIDTGENRVKTCRIPTNTMRPVRGMGNLRYQLKGVRRRQQFVDFNDWRKKYDAINILIGKLGRFGALKIKDEEDLERTLDQVEAYGINVDRVRERTRSREDTGPRILRQISFIPDHETFVDVETGLATGDKPGELWFIGVLRRGEIIQYRYPGEWRTFIEYLRTNKIERLVSWTTYDSKALAPLLKKNKCNIKFLDACQRTSNCVVWHDYRLHDFHRALFQVEEQPTDTLPGHLAGLYADHLILPKSKCELCPPKEEIIEMIKKKNQTDLIEMYQICKELSRKDLP